MTSLRLKLASRRSAIYNALSLDSWMDFVMTLRLYHIEAFSFKLHPSFSIILCSLLQNYLSSWEESLARNMSGRHLRMASA